MPHQGQPEIEPQPVASCSPMAALISKCNRCGFCQEVCPTYWHSKSEARVARGRIQLVRLVTEGRYHWLSDPEIVKQVDDCLLCRACVVNCPAAVATDEIMALARREILKSQGFSLFHTLLYHGLLTRRQRLELVTVLLGAVTRIGLTTVATKEALQRASQQLRYFSAYLPESLDPPVRRHLKKRHRAIGSERLRVGYFIGCATNVFTGRVARALIGHLQHAGCTVNILDSVCCGGPHWAAGDIKSARKLARLNLEQATNETLDAVVSDCATCAHTLQRYDTFFAADDPLQTRIAELRHRIVDINSFIRDRLTPGCGPQNQPLRVTYHDPCHAVRGLDGADAPRELLRSLPGVDLVEMEGADTCCGGAGSYFFRHQKMSQRILAAKITAIQKTGANVVATSCPSCILQLKAGAKRHGAPVKVVHPVELVAQAYGSILPRVDDR